MSPEAATPSWRQVCAEPGRAALARTEKSRWLLPHDGHTSRLHERPSAPGQHPALPPDDSTAKGLWVARALGSLECCSLDCSVLPRPPSAGKAPSPRSTPPRPIPLGDPPPIAVQGRLRWPRFTEGSRLTNKVITITHFGQGKNLNTGLTRPNHLHFFPRHEVVFQRCFSVSISINNNNSNNNNNNKCH